MLGNPLFTLSVVKLYILFRGEKMKLLVILLLPVALSMAWQTKWDAPFTYSCPNNRPLKRIESIHDNGKEDRVFNFFVSSILALIVREWHIP